MRMMMSLAIAAFLSITNSPLADTTFIALSDVTVENASLVQEDDDVYRLLFRLINDSPAEIVLIGVGSVAADSGQMIYYSHHSASEPIESLVLKSDEEVDFSTSHQQALLKGLEISDGKAPFYLLFSRGRIDSEAHVHEK